MVSFNILTHSEKFPLPELVDIFASKSPLRGFETILCISGTYKISAIGGLGGTGVPPRLGSIHFNNFISCGGFGAMGRIRIDSVVFSGHILEEAGVIYRSNMSNLFYVSILHVINDIYIYIYIYREKTSVKPKMR